MKPSSTDRASLGCALLLALAAALALALICAGCKNPNTGSSIVVGDVTSLPEISDASDNISIKVLLMMTGAKVWTAKDSLVKVGYSNCYTNWYCGIIERRGAQNLTVEVEPLEVGGEAEPCETSPAATNAVEEAVAGEK